MMDIRNRQISAQNRAFGQVAIAPQQTIEPLHLLLLLDLVTLGCMLVSVLLLLAVLVLINHLLLRIQQTVVTVQIF